MVEFKKLKMFAQLGLGLVILLWLLQLADLNRVFLTIIKINPLNIAFALSLFIIASFFVGLALYIPLKRSHPTTSLHEVIMASFAGQLLSDVTPARSGYFLTPFILNKLAGIPVARGMIGVLATGGVNSFVKVLLSLTGLFYFLTFLPIDSMIINSLLGGISLLLVGGSFLMLLMWESRLSRLIDRFGGLPIIGKSIRKFNKMFNNIQREGHKVKSSLIYVAILILLSVMANALALYFISSAIWHNPPGPVDFLFIASVASALMYIPITVAGLGVQETGYVFLLHNLFQMPFESAIAFAFLARVLFTGTDIIGIGPLLKISFKGKHKSVFEDD